MLHTTERAEECWPEAREFTESTTIISPRPSVTRSRVRLDPVPCPPPGDGEVVRLDGGSSVQGEAHGN